MVDMKFYKLNAKSLSGILGCSVVSTGGSHPCMFCNHVR